MEREASSNFSAVPFPALALQGGVGVGVFFPSPSSFLPEGCNGDVCLIVRLYSSFMNNITLSGQEKWVGSSKSLFVQSPGLLLWYALWLWHGSSATSRTLVLSSRHGLQLSLLYYPPARASVPRAAPSRAVLMAAVLWLCQIKQRAWLNCSAVWQRPGKEICVNVKSKWISYVEDCFETPYPDSFSLVQPEAFPLCHHWLRRANSQHGEKKKLNSYFQANFSIS